jgi:hypothetical protein
MGMTKDWDIEMSTEIDLDIQTRTQSWKWALTWIRGMKFYSTNNLNIYVNTPYSTEEAGF